MSGLSSAAGGSVGHDALVGVGHGVSGRSRGGWLAGWSGRRLPRWTCVSVSAVLAATLLQAGAEPARAAAPVAAQKAAVAGAGPLVRPDEMSARVTARSSGRRVEVENLRTETSTTWVEPDGLLSSELHMGQIRYRDTTGAWRDVNLALEPVGEPTGESAGESAGAGAVGPVSVDSPVSFAGASTAAERAAGVSDVAVVSEGRPVDDLPPVAAGDAAGAKAARAARRAPGARVQRRVALKWPGVLPAPVVEGAVDAPSGQWAVYRDAAPGVDLRMMALRSGFEQHIVVKDRPAPGADTSWVMPVDTDGLSARMGTGEAAGSVEFVDAAGTVVSRLSAPAAWDSSGGGTVNARGNEPDAGPVGTVALSLLPAASGSGDVRVKVTPDQEWLNDPARVFPVVVDPTYLGATVGVVFDTYVRTGLTTGQSGSTSLEIGTTNSGANIARSYLTFNTAALVGKKIVSANLSINQISAPTGCPQATWQLYTAGRANINTVWGPNAPAQGVLKGTSTQTKGATGCPAGRVGMDVKDFIQNASDNGYTEAGAMLRAGSETSNSGHKIFRSSESTTDPVIAVKYDRAPGVAAAPTVKYVRTSGGVSYVATTRPFAASVASDPDGDTVRFQMQFRSGSTVVTTCTTGYIAAGLTPTIPASSTTASTGPGWCRPAAGTLSDGATYQVRAKTFDGYLENPTWSTGSAFTIGATQPLAPSISCPAPYSNGSWQDDPPTAPVTCTVNVPTSSGHSGPNAPVIVFVTIDGGVERAYRVTPSPTASATITVPATAGGHSISARSQTVSSWMSPTTTYAFGYGAGIVSPVNGATSNDAFRLTAAVKAPTTGGTAATAKLQWRTSGATDPWTDSTLTLSPTATGGGVSVNDVTWRAGADITGAAARTPQLIDIQVCFTFTATSVTTCTWDAAKPVTVLKVPHAFGNGYPTAPAGPAQVALFTGEVNLDATDVTVPGYTGALSVSRSHATFNGPTDAVTGVFGPGWVANLDGPDAGVGGMQVIDATSSFGMIALVDSNGTALTYRQPSKGRVPLEVGTYTPVGADTELDGSRLALSTSGSGGSQVWTLTFTQDDGTITTFQRGTATSTTPQWAPHQVSEPGVTGTTAYSRDASGRVNRIIASPAPGVTCPATGALVPGCRALEITYATITTAAPGTPGDVTGQVKTISMVIFDPDKAGGPGMTTTPVAEYAYDENDRLVSVTDPRSNLGARYGYTGTNASQTDPVRIASVTPAGLKGFRLQYTPAPFKLSSVTRDDVDGGSTPSPVATYVYDIDATQTTVPAGLPDLRAVTVADWGQAKAPVKGYAVFGPDRTPAGTTPDAVTEQDWQYAALQYTDALGYTVNTATYGAGAWQRTAMDYDSLGNVVRAWDARGLEAALQDGEATNADAYATTTRYNGDISNSTNDVVTAAGTFVTDEWGPAREVMLADGTSVWARPHTHTDYDTGAPNAGINEDTALPFRLPTRITLGAAGGAPAPVATVSAPPADLETLSTTTLSYDKITSTDPDTWKLGLPTTTTSVVDGTTTNDVSRVVRYDTEGRVIQTRQPKSSGGDAGTTNTTYYRASGTYDASTAPCDGRPQWGGLVCKVAVGDAPDSGPDVPVSFTSGYSALLQPATVVETSGSGTRTTATTFLADGRLNTSTITSVGITGSTGIPSLTIGYDAATGFATTSSTSSTDYTQTDYDAWGRPTSYRNSLGETTTTTYVAPGSPGAGDISAMSDPKGTTTYGYGNDANDAAERRGMATSVTISGAGTFTGAYDAGAALILQKMPGGLRQDVKLDAAGVPIGLSYSGDVTNNGATSTDVWVAWSQINDVSGRVRREQVPEGSVVADDAANAFDREYAYDPVGRLATVKDRTSSSGALPTADTDPDWAAAACQTRAYSFDKNGNRTTLSSYPGAADGTCQSSTGATIKTWAHDTADRIQTSVGYAYDTFGRATTIPASDSPTGAGLTLGYYDNDAARTITTGPGATGSSTTYTLDPVGRRLQATTAPSSGGTATATVVRHYIDTSDNPAWITDTTADSVTRYGESLGGDLGTQITTNGVSATPVTTARISLVDPHSDLAATVTLPAAGNATGIDSWSDTLEYGTPRAGTPTPTDPGRYNWLGGEQRATDASGLVLMGARLYNPMTGQFTSPDPVPAGSATAYDYAYGDPVNITDLDGRCPFCIYGAIIIAARIAAAVAARRAAAAAAQRVAAAAAQRAAAAAAQRAAVRTAPKRPRVPAPNPKAASVARYSMVRYMVYHIYQANMSPGSDRGTFKYGITRVGDSRPKSQYAACARRMGAACTHRAVVYVTGWYIARIWEAGLISSYVRRTGHLPPGNPAGL